jgi:Kef-type K+ transport system membrane component KefB
MPAISFVGLLIVAVVAFLAPLLLALSPARRLSAVVLEIMAGILIGPSVLGWVKVDLPISILSVLGLAFPRDTQRDESKQTIRGTTTFS